MRFGGRRGACPIFVASWLNLIEPAYLKCCGKVVSNLPFSNLSIDSSGTASDNADRLYSGWLKM
jgi:hypothetical protein